MTPLTGAAAGLLLLLAASPAGAQTTARAAIPLPAPLAALAEAFDSQNLDPSRLLLDVVRMLFDTPDAAGSVNGKLRARMVELMRQPQPAAGELVPLPLAPSVWRETLLDAPAPDEQLIAAILASRDAALLYHGLAALDDETLAWFESDRQSLRHVKKHAGAFAAFGRSLRVRDGRVAVPGGDAAADLWRDLVGADPAAPGEFVRAIFRGDRGRTAFLYDTIAQLDRPRQQAVLNRRLGALASVFHAFSGDWDAELRPFARPQLDPALLLATLRVDDRGALAGPRQRRVWERVFRDDLNLDAAFREFRPWDDDGDEIDAAWIADRIHSVVPFPRGRRRLETFLFGQRVFASGGPEPQVTASVLRAFVSMPALMLTLERAGVTDARAMLAAVRHAQALNGVGERALRETCLLLFQAAVALVDRGVQSGALPGSAATTLLESLAAVPLEGGRDYDLRIAAWVRGLVAAAPRPPYAASDPMEETLLALVAGGYPGGGPIVEWEGQQYRVDPAAAELARLRQVRERQGGPTIDAAVEPLQRRERLPAEERERAQRDFRTALVSLVYAAHLGDPEGPAVAAGNPALKHDLGLDSLRPGVEPMTAWRLPVEVFGGPGGWRVRGSLLALDAALRRLALRRLDAGEIPSGPRLPILERQTAILGVALANPRPLSDESRDELAAALGRGRQRLAELREHPERVGDVAEGAALSGWEREALKWSLAHAPGHVSGALTLVQLFWLGGGAAESDAWGAAALASSGCLCLQMPRPTAWENMTGRPASGLLATLGADVSLVVAEALAERRLPAALAPAVLARAMQDVLDQAQPAYFDDWPAFSRAARAIAPERMDDYIAALTAGGPLVPATRGTF